MKIIEDNRPEEFKRLEDLLEGGNYEVWFNLYGPADSEIGLQEAIYGLVSKKAVISEVVPSTSKKARKEIMSMVLYEGDISHGPLDLETKLSEIAELMNTIFTRIKLDNAEKISEFKFKQGHPAIVIYWDFAYDIHSKGKRWIFTGSSSD
jgi:hypothetical protein